MTKLIPLRVPVGFPMDQHPFTEVSSSDYDYLSQFKWSAKWSDGSDDKYHAVRNVTIGTHSMTVRMHRLITEARLDQNVYHLDGNTLNNTRGNLQSRTIHPWTGRPSGAGYRGVHQMSATTWRAEISFAGNRCTIGNSFSDATTAAKAYDTAAITLYGKHALTNFFVAS